MKKKDIKEAREAEDVVYEAESRIEEEKARDNKATNTAFLLMFPALILAAGMAFWAPLYASLLAIGLAMYQFLMLKKFISDYYNARV